MAAKHFWHPWWSCGHLRRDERRWHLSSYCKLHSASPMGGEQCITSQPAASFNVEKSTSTVLLQLLGCFLATSVKVNQKSSCHLSVEAIKASESHSLRHKEGFVNVSFFFFVLLNNQFSLIPGFNL